MINDKIIQETHTRTPHTQIHTEYTRENYMNERFPRLYLHPPSLTDVQLSTTCIKKQLLRVSTANEGETQREILFPSMINSGAGWGGEAPIGYLDHIHTFEIEHIHRPIFSS